MVKHPPRDVLPLYDNSALTLAFLITAAQRTPSVRIRSANCFGEVTNAKGTRQGESSRRSNVSTRLGVNSIAGTYWDVVEHKTGGRAGFEPVLPPGWMRVSGLS